MSGREIAAIVGVTPPTVSKWRKGRSRIPAAKLVFLTLLLAHGVDEMEELEKRQVAMGMVSPAWRIRLCTHIEAMRRCLKQPEACNAALPPEAIREGTRMFALWWGSGNGKLGDGRAAASVAAGINPVGVSWRVVA